MTARAVAARKPRRVREGVAEPRWLTRAIVEAVHSALVREHGGVPGIRDDGLLDSALTRPRNKWGYGNTDLAVVAAAYAFGLVKSHAFVDGNKRVSITAAAIFLAMNGHDLDVPEPEVVEVVTRLASGRMTEAAFAEWMRAHMTRT